MGIVLIFMVALVSPVRTVSYMCEQKGHTFVGSGPSNEILITKKLVIDLKSGYGSVTFNKAKCKTWELD